MKQNFFMGISRNVITLCGIRMLGQGSGVHAVCPVCTLAVGAGVGLAQWVGIDDTISGLWIGGLTMSMTMWTINWLSTKNIRFFGRKPLVLAGYYGLVLIPLYRAHLIGHPLNTLWGFDKLLLGIVLGSVVFLGMSLWYMVLKARHDGRAYFPFQKVIMPVGVLVLLSLLLCLITR